MLFHGQNNMPVAAPERSVGIGKKWGDPLSVPRAQALQPFGGQIGSEQDVADTSIAHFVENGVLWSLRGEKPGKHVAGIRLLENRLKIHVIAPVPKKDA